MTVIGRVGPEKHQRDSRVDPITEAWSSTMECVVLKGKFAVWKLTFKMLA